MKINALGLGLAQHRVAGSSYSETINNLLSYGDGQGYTRPSSDHLTAIDTAITSLSSEGILSRLDRLFFHFLGSEYGKVNVIDTSQAEAAPIASPVWNIGQGINCVGTGKGLDLNYNLFSDSVNYSLNDCSVFQWIYATPSSNSTNQFSFGGWDGGGSDRNYLWPIESTNSFSQGRLNSGTDVSAGAVYGAGLHHLIRDGAASQRYLFDAIQRGADTTASTSLSNTTVAVGCRKVGVSYTDQYDGNISITGIGDALFDKTTELNTILSTLMSSL